MVAVPGYALITPLCEVSELSLYRARRLRDGLSVLLKYPTCTVPTSSLLRRLEREYELGRTLNLPGVVRPIALERIGGMDVLVLEDGPSRTLRSQLGLPMDISSFLRIAIDVTTTLAELHGRGLIHKDIKPDHVLLDASGRTWLTGLGIATPLPREFQPPAPLDSVAGTLAYMSPEQTGRMNRSIDYRTDLYSLGIMFYQMLTGVLPFVASGPLEWVHCHIARPPVPPSQRVPNVPEALSAMIMKLMAKTAEDRYQSAAGLNSDLRHCLIQWKNEACINRLQEGAHDVPDRLMIPERLYGREAEIDALVAVFDSVVATGVSKVVLVSGRSGSGKTALVQEILKAVVPQNGIFATGKLEQYQHNVPYMALIQILHALITHILGMDSEVMARWRDVMRNAVGTNGQLVATLIPEVELIIGKQSPVPDLPPPEARNRFQMVIRKFVRGFAGPGHPLVIFIDDLHWLDAATLDLLEIIAPGVEGSHILLIGTYRNNEIGPTHPLSQLIHAVRSGRTELHEIDLAPLTIDEVISLVVESLRCDRAQAIPLAQLVFDKTDGNPMFVRQFLAKLVEEKLLAFVPGTGRWTWDLSTIQITPCTDNVIDLLTDRLAHLPGETLEALKHFSCLGSVSDVKTLMAILGQSEAQLDSILRDAISKGLVFRRGNTYVFSHDRVQEALYDSIPEANRKELHLKVGRAVLAQRSHNAISPEDIFGIVDQINQGISLVTNADELATLRHLNTTAGRRARSTTAFASARQYLEIALDLLPPDPWNKCHDESLALHLELAECEYLIGAIGRADVLLATAMGKARTKLEIGKIQRLRMLLMQMSGRYLDALTTAVETMRLFGFSIPQPGAQPPSATNAERRRVDDFLHGRRIIDLCDNPVAEDMETRELIGLLAETVPLIFLLHPEFLLFYSAKAVNILLERGHAEGAAFLYSSYATALAFDITNIEVAQQFSELAIELNKRAFTPSISRGRVLFHHATTISIWLHHPSISLPQLDEAFHACLECGDMTYAHYTSNHIPWLHFESGESLERLVESTQFYVSFALETHNNVVYHLNRLEQQFALSLLGKTRSPTDLGDATFDEAESVAVIERAEFKVGQAIYSIMKQCAAYIDEQYDVAFEWAQRSARILHHVSSCMNQPTHSFVRALTLTALHSQVPVEQQLGFMKAVRDIQDKLNTWMRYCPENFANRYYLVSAEIARIEGHDVEAMRLYDEAIRSATNSGFIQHQALAAEVASRYYRARGFERIADAYLSDAHAWYMRWGAQGKVRQLEQRYPQLRQASAFAPTGSFSSGMQEVDVSALFKMSHAISGEIILDKLLEVMVRALLKVSGAQRGCVLLAQDEQLSLAASAHLETPGIVVRLTGDPILDATDYPRSIAHFAHRTRHKVLIEDVTRTNVYSRDEYFTRRLPKSVLCFPIVRQSQSIGVVYLENEMTAHAFAPTRLFVLELLASQASIALEHALVHKALMASENKYRRIVETTNEGVWVLGPEMNTTFVNSAMAAMLGYSVAEMIDRPIHDFLFEEDSAHCLTHVERSKHASSRNTEWRLRRQDGQALWTLASVSPILDAQYKSQGIFAMFVDITIRKSMEMALARSEREFRTLAANAPGNILRYDRDCRIIYANPQAEVTLGMGAGMLLGKTPREKSDDGTYERFHQILLEVLNTGRPAEFEQVVPDEQRGPRYHQIRFCAERDSNSDIISVMAIGHDVTALRESERRFRTLAESSPSNILRYDIQGHLTYVNTAMKRMLGINSAAFSDHLVCFTIADTRHFVPPGYMTAIRGVLATGQSAAMEVVLTDGPHKGEIHHLRFVPELDPDQKVTGAIVIGDDVSELKKKERELEESRDMLRQRSAHRDHVREEERKHIAREIHDELGQMLAAQSIGLSTLKMQFGTGDPLLVKHCDELLGLVDQTIHVVRDIATALRPASLDMGIIASLEWLTETFRATNGLDCLLRVDGPPPRFDESQSTAVFRIVQESLTNISRHAQARQVEVALSTNGDNHRVIIRDDGIGFDASAHRVESLGLTGIQERALLLGGEVNIKSAPGRGTTIEVIVPRIQRSY